MIVREVMASQRVFVWMAFLSFVGFSSVVCDEDSECNVKSSLQSDPHPDFEETARNLQAQWVTKDTIMVVASSSTTNTNVWLGSKQTTGLFQFKKAGSTIDEEVNAESLTISPSGWNTAIMVSKDRQKLYVSNDAGKSWIKHSLPAAASASDLLMSRVNPSHIVLTSGNDDLFVSVDHGQKWQKIASDASLATFATDSGKNEYLFYSMKQSDGPFNNIYRVDLASGSFTSKVILKNIYRFYVDDKYMFVSKMNYTGHHAFFLQSRRFYVSKNYFGSKPTFTEVQLPSAKWKDHVQVMATHETGAFIHISVSDPEKGTLYVSDASGVRFTVSLPNHLFKRVNVFGSGISFNDFYEVDSIRGVYITVNVSSTGSAKTANHSSVITFNNGGSWQLLDPPKATSDCSSTDSDCSLHLHATYSTLKSYALSNVTLKNGPLSAGNAPGIIIAQGSIGKSRDYDPNKSVIVTSQDGGHTWTKPDIPPGQYTYGIADYGNVIAVVPDSESAKFIWFSHDRGVCFKKESLDTTGYFKLSKGLLMDPKTTSLYAFALGLEGNQDSDAWRLIAINFGSILSSPCHKEDYTTTDLGTSCIMGAKEQYQIVKSDSVCFTDDNYSPKPKRTPCNCTYADMECEFGYTPSWSNGVLNCTIKDKNADSLAKECPPGDKYYYQTKTGLRIVAGNMCKNTTETAKLLAYERKKCQGHEQESGVNTDTHAHAKRTAAQVIGAFIITLALMAAAGLTLYCIVKCRKPREFHDRVMYKKIPLTESGFSDNSDSDDDLLN